MGDAAFGMAGLDIETAVRAEIPILTVVLNNGVMTHYDHYMPYATEHYQSNELGGHYAQVAEALGAHAERVEAIPDLAPAIQRALAANGEGRAASVGGDDQGRKKTWPNFGKGGANGAIQSRSHRLQPHGSFHR